MATFTGTHHIGLKTKNFAELRAFYRDTLGLEEIGAFDGVNIVFFDIGETAIELIEAEPDAPAGGFAHLALQVADCDATRKALGEKGIEFHVEPRDVPENNPQVRIAFFRDPDGNELELVQPLVGRYPDGTPTIDVSGE